MKRRPSGGVNGTLRDPAKWDKLSEEIAELAAKVPEAGSTLPNSPVADY